MRLRAAIGSMDQATQQNAAMVEQTSAAARNLTGEVETLAAEADRFKTEEESGRSVRAARAQPAQRPASPAPKHFVPAARTPAGADDWNSF